MNELLNANIFFFITSIAVIVFSTLLCVALYYVIKILVSVRAIVERVEEGSAVIAEDIVRVRKYVIGGRILADVLGFFTRRGSRSARSTKRRATKDD